MELVGGRPLIQSEDFPQTIVRALRYSAWAGYEDMSSNWPRWDWSTLDHIAHNEWERIEDGFAIVGDEMYRPDGEQLVYLSPDHLEFALVAYGCKLLSNPDARTDREIAQIDTILHHIDRARTPDGA